MFLQDFEAQGNVGAVLGQEQRHAAFRLHEAEPRYLVFRKRGRKQTLFASGRRGHGVGVYQIGERFAVRRPSLRGVVGCDQKLCHAFVDREDYGRLLA